MTTKLRSLAQALINEVDGLREAKDTSSEAEWWRQLDWKSPDYRPLLDSLGGETRKLIIKAGLVADDLVEEEYQGNVAHMTLSKRAQMFFSISEDEWAGLSEEEKEDYISRLPPEKQVEGTTNKDESEEDCPDCEKEEGDEEECPEGQVWNEEHTECIKADEEDDIEDDDTTEILETTEDELDPAEVIAKYRRTLKDKDYPY